MNFTRNRVFNGIQVPTSYFTDNVWHLLVTNNLVGEGKTSHTGLDAKNVVVDCEHGQGGVVGGIGLKSDFDLGVINTREVACTSGL